MTMSRIEELCKKYAGGRGNRTLKPSDGNPGLAPSYPQHEFIITFLKRTGNLCN